MTSVKHLSRAPITEALLDLRVKARKDFKPGDFSVLKQELAANFPRVEERSGFETTVQFKAGASGSQFTRDLGLQGYFFFSSDGLNIAQFRVDGFTFNRLAPYTSWDSLLPEALRLWVRYVEIAQPEFVSRIALRYINQIVVPPGAPLDDIMVAPPRVPTGISKPLSAFLTRITIQDPTKGISAHVTQALNSSTKGAAGSLILDIDAFKEVSIEPSEADVSEALTSLRTFKNRIFFGSLTESTLKSFE
jgi:uncharacterized protein (TIGR04255 family)